MSSAARRRLFSWIACSAVLLNALAPGVSHALAAWKGDRAAWSQICSVAGVRWVQADDDLAIDQELPADAMKGGMEHCPFCLTHAGSVGLMPPIEFSFDASGGHDLLPILFYVSPRPLFNWAAAHPRAPPVAS